MQSFLLAIFGVAVFAAEALVVNRQTCPMTPVKMNSTQINAVLAQHNQYRASEAAEMKKTIPAQKWNDTLAQRAQAWTDYLAQTQTFSHGYLNLCSGASLGQNLWSFGSSSASNLPSLSAAVTSWYSERANYNYNTNKCAKGKVCGHYTQIVWAASTQIGCGASYYKKGIFYNVVVACNYFTPGNYVGKKPY